MTHSRSGRICRTARTGSCAISTTLVSTSAPRRPSAARRRRVRLAEQAAVFEHRDDGLATIASLRHDRDASVGDDVERFGRITLTEQQLVPFELAQVVCA